MFYQTGVFIYCFDLLAKMIDNILTWFLLYALCEDFYESGDNSPDQLLSSRLPEHVLHYTLSIDDEVSDKRPDERSETAKCVLLVVSRIFQKNYRAV